MRKRTSWHPPAWPSSRREYKRDNLPPTLPLRRHGPGGHSITPPGRRRHQRPPRVLLENFARRQSVADGRGTQEEYRWTYGNFQNIPCRVRSPPNPDTNPVNAELASARHIPYSP